MMMARQPKEVHNAIVYGAYVHLCSNSMQQRRLSHRGLGVRNLRCTPKG